MQRQGNKEVLPLTLTAQEVTCATMGDTWHQFYRRAAPGHLLEAKVAVGGEPYGNDDMNCKAEKGQWLCRNPENGHCWVMDDEGMFDFFAPFDKEMDDWKALLGKMKEKEKLAKIKKKPPDQSKKRALDSRKKERASLF